MPNYRIHTKELILTSETKTVYGILRTPQNRDGRLPAVILSHGYNSSHTDVADMAEALAEKCGMLTFAYDFCGGSLRSMSSGVPTQMSIATEVEDLKTVIEAVRKMEQVDAERIVLYGESQGGFVSALAGTELAGEIAGMVLLYPAFCIPDDWKALREKGLPKEFDFMGMTISDCFYDGLPKEPVFTYIGGFQKPVWIFQGDCDEIVSPDYARRAAAGFPNAELHMVPGEGHGFSKKAREAFVKQICTILA